MKMWCGSRRQLWSKAGHHILYINHNVTWFYLQLTLKAKLRLSPATTSSITVLFFTSRPGNMLEMSVWLQLNMPSGINCLQGCIINLFCTFACVDLEFEIPVMCNLCIYAIHRDCCLWTCCKNLWWVACNMFTAFCCHASLLPTWLFW